MLRNSYGQSAVNRVFSAVSGRYDVMNSIMSAGMHGPWRRRLVQHVPVPVCGQKNMLLDVAAGTGDVASLIRGYSVIACDISMSMIRVGLSKTCGAPGIQWVQCSAEKLPFAADVFDCCSIAFGIRNVENRAAALMEFLRVLKPGGKFVCMEFSRVDKPVLDVVYSWYLRKVIPMMGHMVAGDKEAYDYLADSIMTFPGAQEFAGCMSNLGFSSVTCHRLAMGAVAIHSGYKLRE